MRRLRIARHPLPPIGLREPLGRPLDKLRVHQGFPAELHLVIAVLVQGVSVHPPGPARRGGPEKQRTSVSVRRSPSFISHSPAELREFPSGVQGGRALAREAGVLLGARRQADAAVVHEIALFLGKIKIPLADKR